MLAENDEINKTAALDDHSVSYSYVFDSENIKRETTNVSQETIFIKCEFDPEEKCKESVQLGKKEGVEFLNKDTVCIKEDIDITKYIKTQIKEENVPTIQSDQFCVSGSDYGSGLANKHGFLPNEIQICKENICPQDFDACQKKFIYCDKHTELHSMNKTYTCKACNVSFVFQRNINDHMKTHCSVTDHRRSACGKTFTFQCSMKDHVQMKERKEYVCNSCHIFFTTKFDLQHHVITHDSLKNGKCNNCGVLFKSKYDLYYHFETYSVSSAFTCNICEQSFQTIFSLVMGHMHSHYTINRSVCYALQKSFKSNPNKLCQSFISNPNKLCQSFKSNPHKLCQSFKSNPNKLCQSFKSNPKKNFHLTRPLACQICKKTFKFKSSFVSHLCVRKKVKYFPCNLCKKLFKSNKSLSDHLCTYSFTCDICRASFVRKDLLSSNLLTHHEATNKSCVSGKSYVTKFELCNKRVEKYARAQQCNVCYKLVTQDIGLRLHSQTHLDFKTNTCNVCDTLFDDFDTVYSHVQKHVFAQ